MKNMKKILNIITASVLAVLTIGCTGSFDEVNTDPDRFTQVPYTNQLADVLRSTGSTMGNEIEGYGTWAGYIVKIQYMDYMSGYIPTNNTYGNRWRLCYINNSQLNDILSKTESEPEAYRNLRSVCRIWKEYMWYYLLTGWGDIPYTDALKGSVEDGQVLQVKYDKQEDIYPIVMANMKAIADEMGNGLGTDKIGEGDFIYNGDVVKWQKFLNSLRLRTAMRLVNVAPELAKSTIEEICSNPEKYPVIDSNDASCYLWWQGSGEYFEPWYNNKRTRDDHGLSDIFIDHMKEMEDPRIASIAHPAQSDGEYRGYANGPADIADLKTVSRIGTIYRDDPAGFTPFFKACETYYTIAEAAMLGWNVGMSAEAAYEKAVRLSMEDNNISQEAADAYLAGKGKWDNTIERIWWDEWVALFKDNFEGWSLYRRTGVPTTNYPAIESIWGSDHNDMPFRVPYPNNEFLYNKANVNEAIDRQGIVNYCWGQQLWWDTRTGVY